jgi:hypothetical protein
MFAQIIRRRLALSARQNGSHIRSSSRTYATRPGSASYRPSLGVTAVIASAFTLALTQLWSTRTVVSADSREQIRHAKGGGESDQAIAGEARGRQSDDKS